MPVWQDSKEPKFFVPEGDYVFCVIGFEKKYSQGAKTAGSEQYELKCEVEGHNCYFFDTLTVHEKTIWRLESFLRSTGNALKDKGTVWSFVESEAIAQGGTYIKPLGLRGYAHLCIDEYPVGSGQKKNKVACYLALEGKRIALRPREIAAPKEEDDIPF